MTEFTASNGVKIVTIPTGQLYIQPHDAPQVGVRSAEVAAITEFVIAQQDEKYGRVRLPEYPDYVIYLSGDGDIIYALNEKSGVSRGFNRYGRFGVDTIGSVALAYFERNPEPTPLPIEPGIYADGSGTIWRLRADGTWSHLDSTEGEYREGREPHPIGVTRLVPEVTP